MPAEITSKRPAFRPGMSEPHSVSTASTSSTPSASKTFLWMAMVAPSSSPSSMKEYGFSPAMPTVTTPSSWIWASVPLPSAELSSPEPLSDPPSPQAARVRARAAAADPANSRVLRMLLLLLGGGVGPEKPPDATPGHVGAIARTGRGALVDHRPRSWFLTRLQQVCARSHKERAPSGPLRYDTATSPDLAHTPPRPCR